ncbi:MAG: sigma 54-interacting transcriptional regulator [Thermotaleaceae bacterium]
MKKIEEIYEGLIALAQSPKGEKGITAEALGEYLELHRSNVSRYLNHLYSENRIEKIQGRPVKYLPIVREKAALGQEILRQDVFEKIIGAKESLHIPIQQAKAAILYPPNGLHTLLLGETGVGKTMFAERMHHFAIDAGILGNQAPLITFNCADYADNAQLLLGQLFGVKKGAYTGADKDREGLLKKADGGILFLDEVHRLSSPGQEILFTYIDKGFFRRLGDTEEVIYANTLIIAATTESPQSYLLKTFTRRIPMVITLPSLKDRTLGERLYLIEAFFREESKRLSRSIYISKNCLISFLLYDCPNNIGQLKSDIQLTCAKAFLNYKFQKKDYILATPTDLPQNVKSGMMKIKEKREQVEEVIHCKGDVLRFCYDEMTAHDKVIEDDSSHQNFYDVIEKQVRLLQAQGLQEHEINEIVNVDIESYFKKFMGNLFQQTKKTEILKVVEANILNLTEKILDLAQSRLSKVFDEKVCYGLALHISGMIQRLKNGNRIFNPKLNFIRVQYPDEFLIAMEAAKMIEKELYIELPLDEIGYITMFFSTESIEQNYSHDNERVGVLLLMHGNTTATSMAEVVNRLIGERQVEALDMPLEIPPEDFYQVVKEKVVDIHQGKGVLIMVDMGSLVNFGDMIYEETGIQIMSVDMVSTLTVLEACRKSVMNRSLKEIYDSCKEIYPHQRSKISEQGFAKRNAIITACFTGEGAAERLIQVLENNLKLDGETEIKALNLLDRKSFSEELEEYRKKWKVLAVVGTVEVNIPEVPFISAYDILTGEGMKQLQEIVDKENLYYRMGISLKEHLTAIDPQQIIIHVRAILEDIQRELQIMLEESELVGMLLHICFMLEKVKKRESLIPYKNKQEVFSKYSREFTIVKQQMKEIEEILDVEIGVDEICYLTKIIVENSSVQSV